MTRSKEGTWKRRSERGSMSDSGSHVEQWTGSDEPQAEQAGDFP